VSSLSSEHFLQSLGVNKNSIFSHLLEHDFQLTLVGGAVREYLISSTLPSDLDFEIRSVSSERSEGSAWVERLAHLPSILRTYSGIKSKVELLPCNVFRFAGPGGREFELSSPRIESFPNDSSGLGHSDFDLNYSGTISYPDAFRRRDLTVNALGIAITCEGQSWCAELVDPFDGISDLKNSLLREIDPNFIKDPVRLLRMIRFELSLGFTLSDTIVKLIPEFNLSHLTSFYFVREGLKAGFFPFIHQLFQVVNQHHIALPLFLQQISSTQDWPKLPGIFNKEEVALILLLAEIDRETLLLMIEMMQLKKRWRKNLVRIDSWLKGGLKGDPPLELKFFLGCLNNIGDEQIAKLKYGEALLASGTISSIEGDQ
jgi:hypothetical protein